jgi:hypothetical protein
MALFLLFHMLRTFTKQLNGEDSSWNIFNTLFLAIDIWFYGGGKGLSTIIMLIFWFP